LRFVVGDLPSRTPSRRGEFALGQCAPPIRGEPRAECRCASLRRCDEAAAAPICDLLCACAEA